MASGRLLLPRGHGSGVSDMPARNVVAGRLADSPLSHHGIGLKTQYRNPATTSGLTEPGLNSLTLMANNHSTIMEPPLTWNSA